MVRVRLEGLPDEVHRTANAMQAAGCVLERSREYPNRGESRYVRVYLECDIPEGLEVSRHDSQTWSFSIAQERGVYDSISLNG